MVWKVICSTISTRLELPHFEDKDMDWTVQNVIDSKDQMTFKVLVGDIG
jgi:hypothetical protein